MRFYAFFCGKKNNFNIQLFIPLFDLEFTILSKFAALCGFEYY
jgi:hypothetical protein